MLIIAKDIAHARQYYEYLRRLAVFADIATSADDNAAKRTIRKFRGEAMPECDVLVSVAMAYEGLDVPQITHVFASQIFAQSRG